MACNCRALIFLLAFVLLVSTKVSPMEEDDDIFTEKSHHHHHHVHGPSRAPAPAPVKQPLHFPKKRAPAPAPVHRSPRNAPIYPPNTAPAYPPETSRHHYHGKCVQLCIGPKGYCRSLKKAKRECETACVPCCDQYKCVPGPNRKCASWDKVWHHGRYIHCPKS